MEKIKILELFGGIGAPRKALENLGYQVESDYVEIDEHATKSYNVIYNENNTPISVTDFKGQGKKYELLFHGSPCQDFSIAGKRGGGNRGTGTRSSLMWETVRIVEECQPPIVVWENVKGVLTGEAKKTFEDYLDYLKDLGYTNYYKVLNAKDYGIPQNRERIFVVSFFNNDKIFIFPKKQKLLINVKDLLEKEVDKKYFISKHANGNLIKNNKVKKNNENMIVDGYFSKELDKLFWPRETILSQNGVSGTLLTRRCYLSFINTADDDSNCELKREYIRSLTPLECWRLMGFDDQDFEKAKKQSSENQLYKQAGNSIVVPVLEALFKEILSDQVLDLKSLCENKEQLQTNLF